MTPRDYQIELIESARASARAGVRRILLTLPTGGGKTVIAAEIINGAVARGSRVLFLAHRQELIQQASEKLDALGIDHGIIQANHWRRRPALPVQVASVPTLVNRTLATSPHIIFIDEAHRARAASYQAIVDRYPHAFVIGLTATPIRSDGKGLGNLFQRMVQGPSVADLTARGYLVPARVFAPSTPDLRGVRITGGDYNAGGIQRAMDRPTITGDIVAHWQRLAKNRITVLFAAGIDHSMHLRDAFRAAGVAAEHLDGKTDKDTRRKLLADLAVGRIRVMCSVGVLTEGWDSPPVSCAIIARPTASAGLYLQMAGRILRPYPGKTDALLLDHAGCTIQHGLVDDDREWSLELDRPVVSKPRIDLSLPRVCPECYRVARLGVRVCECGYEFSMSDRGNPDVVDGELVEVTSQTRWAGVPEGGRRAMYLRWVSEGAERGYAAGYAGAKYRGVFKESPKTEWMLEASLAHPEYFRKPNERTA